MNDLDHLKKIYSDIKKRGKEQRISYLNSIVEYCKHIGFDREKTMMMLALIRNILPSKGQKFTDCDLYDDIDIEFNKSLDGLFLKG